jgi:hypothetical protein
MSDIIIPGVTHSTAAFLGDTLRRVTRVVPATNADRVLSKEPQKAASFFIPPGLYSLQMLFDQTVFDEILFEHHFRSLLTVSFRCRPSQP